jgi:surfeit locus 1 family protein
VTSRIALSFGTRRFSASLEATLGTVALAALLLTLGMWQLHRAHFKESLEQTYQARSSDEAVRLSAPVSDPGWLRFRRVRAEGRYDAQHQVLLDNRVHQGRAGYEVYSPFHIEDTGLWVLVNRGWVPLGRTRAELPDVAVPAGTVAIQGLMDLPPGKTLLLGESETPGWPKVVQRVDLDELSERLGRRLEPAVLLLDAQVPGGFVRRWQLGSSGVARHYSYAVQWFAMAAVLILLYGVLNTRRVESSARDDSVDTRVSP